MATTLGDLKSEVLTILNKTATRKGFYTDAKMNLGIREAFDYIAVKMFEAGDGWQNKLREIDVPSGTLTVPIPHDIAFINQLRILIGAVWYPVPYDERRDSALVTSNFGGEVAPPSYKIVDNMFYFNPTLLGGTKLQVECTTFPKRYTDDGDVISGHFPPAMRWFLVYRCCSFLVRGMGTPDPAWKVMENDWYDAMMTCVSKRVNAVKWIRDFC